MTNDELIHWAHLENHPELRAELDALIWIAQNKALTEMWRKMEARAKQEKDGFLLSSYPGGLLKRRKKAPTDEDYMAALGPCGK